MKTRRERNILVGVVAVAHRCSRRVRIAPVRVRIPTRIPHPIANPCWTKVQYTRSVGSAYFLVSETRGFTATANSGDPLMFQD